MPTAPLAYKYVVIAVMMAEVNYCAEKLQLNEQLPIRAKDIIAQRAHEPATTGFIGGIDTPEYHFGFVHGGKYRIITKLEDYRYQSMGLYRGNQPLVEFMEQFSQIKSTINTNDAYRMATNWLKAIGVDVEILQNDNPVTVEQQFFMSEKRGRVPVPLFDVKWGREGLDDLGHPKLPIISMLISGINGELLSLVLERFQSLRSRAKQSIYICFQAFSCEIAATVLIKPL